MAHGNQVAAANEETCLAQGKAIIQPLAGFHGDEDGIAIDLQLGTLMGTIGVLNRELMKAELVLQRQEHFMGGLQEADPNDLACSRLHTLGIIDIEVLDLTAALIERAIHHVIHLAFSQQRLTPYRDSSSRAAVQDGRLPPRDGYLFL